MNKKVLFRLDDNDLGQILEGLRVREESWRKTADYFRSGHNPDDSFVIEECNGEHEADQIALFYSRIIRDLERQREQPPNLEREPYLQGKADGQDNLIRRVLDNWKQLQQLDSPALHPRLLELKDEICDD
ncbi:MAG TPA: hypothetical protein VIK59_08500 [Verrucomicrobiae bacterium]